MRGATESFQIFASLDCTFLSTLPARGATSLKPAIGLRYYISIHAPREGSDGSSSTGSSNQLDFYPRSPRGERPRNVRVIFRRIAISIHAPREGSDSNVIIRGDLSVISIHAPREGSDGNTHCTGGHP